MTLSLSSSMRALGGISALLLAAGTLGAHTRGSEGTGLWSLEVDFAPGFGGNKSVTVPASGNPGAIPRADVGSLQFDSGLISTPNTGAATVTAKGAFTHWTPEGNAFGKTNNHYGIFTTLPQGTFSDQGGLATGDDIITFRFEFDIDFFVDGLGIPNVPIGFRLPVEGQLPEGYSADWSFTATWEDTTDGNPQAAAVTLADGASAANPFGSGILQPFADTMNDSGFFGPITDPSFELNNQQAFRVHGAFEINIDKDDARAQAEDIPWIIRVEPEVGDWIQDPAVIPEPSALLLLGLGGLAGALLLRRRR